MGGLYLKPLLIKLALTIIPILICYFSYFKFYKKLPHADWPHCKYFYRYFKYIWTHWYWHTLCTGKTKVSEAKRKNEENRMSKMSKTSKKSQVKPSQVNDSDSAIRVTVAYEVTIPKSKMKSDESTF